MDEISIAADMFGVLDRVPMGVAIIRRDYVILFWNSCLEDWTGIKKSEAVGAPLTRHFKHFEEPRYGSRLESIFDGGPPAIFSSQLHKDLFPTKSRGHRSMALHTIVTAVRDFNRAGHYAMFAISDVTELTQRIQGYRAMRDKALLEIEQRKRAETEKANLITELKDALASVNTLRGMLPICSACHKIRDDRGYWSQIEAYISEHSEATFSHGICPSCMKSLYPEFAEENS
jgi:PAS domain-containing protein